MSSSSRDKAKPTGQLQIALILPYPYCPEWQLRLAARLDNLDDYSVSVVSLKVEEAAHNLRRDLFSSWRKLDTRVFATDEEAAGQRGHEELPHDLSAGEPACQHVFMKLDQLVEITKDQTLDVILWMLPGFPPTQLLGQAKFGVWSLSSVKNDAVGFWELVESAPVVTCELFTSESNPARHRILSRAFAKTDHLSLTKTLRRVRAIDESLVVSKLGEFHRNGKAVSQLPPAEKDSVTRSGRPGTLRLLGALARLYGRYSLSIVTRRFHRDQWQLAYRIGGERLSQSGLTRLSPEDGGFWADPFVVCRDDRTMIFFEEYEAATSKGRIVAVEIDPNGSAGPMKIVLDRDHHLSYPFLFEYEDSLYMIPESADAGRVEAFRCIEFPDRWESHAVLLDNIRAFDATLLEHDGRWWMFAAVQHNGNTTCDELQLFYAQGPFNKWTPHPANPISIDIRCARPAGAFYQHEGQLYRPAQDCSVRYGYALSIQRVKVLDVDNYEEETVQRILPEWSGDIRGTHTVNQSDGITVYDCFVRRRK